MIILARNKSKILYENSTAMLNLASIVHTAWVGLE